MTEIKCILHISMTTGFQIFHCVIHVKTLENIICFFLKKTQNTTNKNKKQNHHQQTKHQTYESNILQGIARLVVR